MAGVLQDSRRQLSKAAAKIDQAIASKGELARGAAPLHCPRNVDQRTSVMVDLVGETAANGFAHVIEPLLRVTNPGGQFTVQNTRASVDVTPKLDNIGYNEFRS